MILVFLELVKKVGIFVIIGQTIQHFGISKKYEKYMKFMISIIVVAQITFAFGIYIKQFKNRGIFMSGTEYKNEWEVNMEKVEEKIKEYNLQLSKSLEEEFQESEYQINRDKKEESGGVYVEKIIIP